MPLTTEAVQQYASPAQNHVRPGSTSVRTVILAATGLAYLLFVSANLQAQDGNSWIDKRVVPKYRGFQLRIGNRATDPEECTSYRVEQVNGPWLLLRSEGRSLKGWAPADRVVPVEQAIDFFTDQIRANPKDPHGYIMRAIIWHDEEKELDIALGDYNEAIRLDPKHAQVYDNRGTIWQEKGENDKAIADYSKAIQLDPKLGSAYNNRGNAWSDKGEHDKAIADYSKAIQLDPKLAAPYVNRGTSWRDKKEYDKAIADYNEAIRRDPKVAEAYDQRAWLWATCPDAKHRDGKNAIGSATKACEMSAWKVPDFMDTLAAAYAETGDFDAAVKWQSRAMELHDDASAKDDCRTRLMLYRDRKPYRQTDP